MSLERSHDGYKTQYFHLSPKSAALFDKMKASLGKKPNGNSKNVVAPSSLKKFLKMEEKILVLELFAICGGKNMNVLFPDAFQAATKHLAEKYHKAMKKSKILMRSIRAVQGSLKHHQKHMRQINKNRQMINRNAWNSKNCATVHATLNGDMFNIKKKMNRELEIKRKTASRKGANKIKADRKLISRLKKMVAVKKMMDRDATKIEKQKDQNKKLQQKGLRKLKKFVEAQKKAMKKRAKLVKAKKLELNRARARELKKQVKIAEKKVKEDAKKVNEAAKAQKDLEKKRKEAIKKGNAIKKARERQSKRIKKIVSTKLKLDKRR